MENHFKNLLTPLNNLNICSNNAYESKVCEVLGSEFTKVNGKYHDLIFNGCEKIEIKKQSNGQWFDLKKMADLQDDEKNIKIVWLLHKNKKFYDIRINTYEDVINFLDHNLYEGWKEWAVAAPSKSEIKHPISLKQINNTTKSIIF